MGREEEEKNEAHCNYKAKGFDRKGRNAGRDGPADVYVIWGCYSYCCVFALINNIML